MRLTLILPLILVASAGLSSAAPLVATEVGDFQPFATPPATLLGTLDIGINSISGTASSSFLDYDFFMVQLDQGNVTGLELVVSNLVNGASGISQIVMVVGGNSSSTLFGPNGTHPMDWLWLSILAPPRPTTLGFQIKPGGDEQAFDSFNYTLNIIVTTPEPSTWLLGALGLFVIACLVPGRTK